MLTVNKLVTLSTAEQAAAMLHEFELADEPMVRDRLIAHLNAAEQRGKDIRDMFAAED